MLKGKIIPVGKSTIEGIQRDPTEIMGWYNVEEMEAWKNIFPLKEVSAVMVLPQPCRYCPL